MHKRVLALQLTKFSVILIICYKMIMRMKGKVKATGALIILEMLLFLASFDRTYVLIVCRETQEVVAETKKYVNSKKQGSKL